jgi:hypothetical protein
MPTGEMVHIWALLQTLLKKAAGVPGMTWIVSRSRSIRSGRRCIKSVILISLMWREHKLPDLKQIPERKIQALSLLPEHGRVRAPWEFIIET